MYHVHQEICSSANISRNSTARDLRKYEKYYILACYGIPFIPAILYIILDVTMDTGIYGPAVVSLDRLDQIDPG